MRSDATLAPTCSRAAKSFLARCALCALFLAAVAPIVTTLPLPAQETPGDQAEAFDRWTPELQMRFRSAGPTALSPDGSRVVFGVSEAVMEGEESEYRTHLWIAPTDGSRAPNQLTRGEEGVGSPAFSPDGELLAFTTSRSGESQVWLIRLDGGEAWQATAHPTGVSSFRWHPEKRVIAYTARDEEPEEVKEAKEEKRYVERVDQEFRYGHLWTADLSGTGGSDGPAEGTRLTEGEFHVSSFDWSADGERLAYAHRPDPRINTARLAGDVSWVSRDGGEGGELVRLGGVETSPRWAPDRELVAFVGTGDQPEPVGLGDIYVVEPGGEPRRLAATPDRSPSLLGWSPDGSAVRVMGWVGTVRRVMELPVDGSPPRTLLDGPGVVGSVSFAHEGGRVAFTWEDPDTPEDVYVARTDGSARTRVSDLHAEVPRPPMGRTELLSWRSPDGRFEIEGLLTYPVGYEEGRRYPLVLNVHGGPAGVYTQGYTGGRSLYMLQTFAQEGYAVLRPNPRGSTGYGKEFRYANVRDWGYGDLDDLLAGVDHVVEAGVAHPDSLLLMGWSYGGYMTSFAVTRTDRFQAASMGAGLPNLISMVTTTDIQDYLAAHMGAEFWEDYEAYERHSAIYRIDRVTTPTQVIHGANDLRVPFTQGQEFYRGLDRLGVPTEMIVLPRTPHGPREPKLLMAVTPAILAWFETHLGRGAPAAATDRESER